ncbi:MAG: hypothetical protein PHQ46_06825 [Negativicutes bacterium]|nr:hypothetical protein [Negativicutes bacterium]
MKGYKGYDKNLQCRNFQYGVGQEYKEETAKACEAGFHFCENPLDVFSYYPPASSRYTEVEGSGDVDRDGQDSKIACTHIRIGAEIGLNGLLSAGVKFILDKVEWSTKKESNTGYKSAATNTGDQSAATNTGYESAATNTGDQSAATNTGDQSAATNTGYKSAATNTGYKSAATNTGYKSAASVEGKQSIACGLGIENKAKGALGCWLVLAEWFDAGNEWQLKAVKSVLVDGETIQADTWYRLVKGEFVEAGDD